MFEDAQDLMDAIEGNQGEEMQEQALAFAQEIGLVDQWIADEEAEEAGSYDDALEAEFQRLEQTVGKLTPDIEQHIIDSISTDQRGQGIVPDLVASYAEPIASGRNTEEGRLHHGAVAAEEAFNQQAEEQGRPSFTPPESAGGGGRFDDGAEEE